MTTELWVPDASCGDCKFMIESAGLGDRRVTGVDIDLEMKRLTIECASSVDADELSRDPERGLYAGGCRVRKLLLAANALTLVVTACGSDTDHATSATR
jgi:hypothetical protein